MQEERPQAKKYRWLLEAGKDKETNTPLEPYEHSPASTLLFSPVGPHFKLLNKELEESKFVHFQATKSVVAGYSNNRTLIRPEPFLAPWCCVPVERKTPEVMMEKAG